MYAQVVESGVPINKEVPFNSADVNASWLHFQVVPLGDGIALTSTDISARKHAELQLEKALASIQTVIDASPYSILVTDPNGLITAVNPATERMLWYSRSEMVGKLTPLELHDPAEIRRLAAELSAELATPIPPGIEVLLARPRRGIPVEDRWTYLRKDGSRLPVQVTTNALHDESGQLTGFMKIAIDITERKRQEDYISHIAHHDILTGLPTRMLFRDRVDVAIQRCQRYKTKCAVMLLDLDNFKDINDSLGHHAGDELLTVIAARLAETLRATDTVARMGGDEFTILLDQVQNEEDAALVAHKILQNLEFPVLLGADSLSISASLGIATYPDAGTTSTILLKHADTAMYHAKGSGKRRFSFFSQDLADASIRRLQLEMALKKALDSNEFSLVYQPQISLSTGAIVGVEALLRWNSEKLGFVSPAEFIPVAEQCGVIVPLGDWVIRTACTHLSEINRSRFPDADDLRLAVNVSPRQLEREGFSTKVHNILTETGFPAHRLEIEITEGVFMKDSPQVWEAIRELQALGLQTAIDDFGTGFSNVSYLLKLAVNRIKIDRSFIMHLEKDSGSVAVVSSLISMAADLGVAVIAEGVENEEQATLLRKKLCDEAQGYLYHRPMPLAALQSLTTQPALATHP